MKTRTCGFLELTDVNAIAPDGTLPFHFPRAITRKRKETRLRPVVVISLAVGYRAASHCGALYYAAAIRKSTLSKHCQHATTTRWENEALPARLCGDDLNYCGQKPFVTGGHLSVRAREKKKTQTGG